MKRTIEVHVGESSTLVGRLHHDHVGGRERAAFAYAEPWLSTRDAFALEPALPLIQGPQFPTTSSTGAVFHGAIADTEPDGWARQVILRDHAKQRQATRQRGGTSPPSLLSAIDFLLAVDDFSRVGAVRFRDERGIFCRPAEPGRRAAPPLVELRHLLAASRAVETWTETAADLAYLRGRGTSLGGLRPKCSVIDDDGQLAIGKFPSVGDQLAVTKGEILSLRLARNAGVNAAAARLVDSDGAAVALVRRFDRTHDGRRVPYVSAATLIGGPEGDGREHFYTEVVEGIRQYGAAAREDSEELWRRLVFSILATNVDDHLKNHGFLHVGHGLWRLAPAFDINPFPDRARELKTWPGEETGPSATIAAALAVRGAFGIPRDRSLEIIRETERAVAGWRVEAKRLGMTAREIDDFADAFEHPERAAARRAGRV